MTRIQEDEDDEIIRPEECNDSGEHEEVRQNVNNYSTKGNSKSANRHRRYRFPSPPQCKQRRRKRGEKENDHPESEQDRRNNAPVELILQIDPPLLADFASTVAEKQNEVSMSFEETIDPLIFVPCVADEDEGRKEPKGNRNQRNQRKSTKASNIDSNKRKKNLTHNQPTMIRPIPKMKSAHAPFIPSASCPIESVLFDDFIGRSDSILDFETASDETEFSKLFSSDEDFSQEGDEEKEDYYLSDNLFSDEDNVDNDVVLIFNDPRNRSFRRTRRTARKRNNIRKAKYNNDLEEIDDSEIERALKEELGENIDENPKSEKKSNPSRKRNNRKRALNRQARKKALAKESIQSSFDLLARNENKQETMNNEQHKLTPQKYNRTEIQTTVEIEEESTFDQNKIKPFLPLKQRVRNIQQDNIQTQAQTQTQAQAQNETQMFTYNSKSSGSNEIVGLIIGNHVRMLTPNMNRPHSFNSFKNSTINTGSNNPPDDTHVYTLYIKPHPNFPELFHSITSVRFLLHDSVSQNDVIVHCPPFWVSRRGWGEFEAKVYIEVRGCSAEFRHIVSLGGFAEAYQEAELIPIQQLSVLQNSFGGKIKPKRQTHDWLGDSLDRGKNDFKRRRHFQNKNRNHNSNSNPPISLSHLSDELAFAERQYPLIGDGKEYIAMPYSVAFNEAEFSQWTVGKRASSQRQRAQLIRDWVHCVLNFDVPPGSITRWCRTRVLSLPNGQQMSVFASENARSPFDSINTAPVNHQIVVKNSFFDLDEKYRESEIPKVTDSSMQPQYHLVDFVNPNSSEPVKSVLDTEQHEVIEDGLIFPTPKRTKNESGVSWGTNTPAPPPLSYSTTPTIYEGNATPKTKKAKRGTVSPSISPNHIVVVSTLDVQKSSRICEKEFDLNVCFCKYCGSPHFPQSSFELLQKNCRFKPAETPSKINSLTTFKASYGKLVHRASELQRQMQMIAAQKEMKKQSRIKDFKNIALSPTVVPTQSMQMQTTSLMSNQISTHINPTVLNMNLSSPTVQPFINITSPTVIPSSSHMRPSSPHMYEVPFSLTSPFTSSFRPNENPIVLSLDSSENKNINKSSPSSTLLMVPPKMRLGSILNQQSEKRKYLRIPEENWLKNMLENIGCVFEGRPNGPLNDETSPLLQDSPITVLGIAFRTFVASLTNQTRSSFERQITEECKEHQVGKPNSHNSHYLSPPVAAEIARVASKTKVMLPLHVYDAILSNDTFDFLRGDGLGKEITNPTGSDVSHEPNQLSAFATSSNVLSGNDIMPQEKTSLNI